MKFLLAIILVMALSSIYGLYRAGLAWDDHMIKERVNAFTAQKYRNAGIPVPQPASDAGLCHAFTLWKKTNYDDPYMDSVCRDDGVVP